MLPLVMVAGFQCLPGLAQDSEVLAKVEVQGAKKQTPETVLFKAGLKEGDDLRNIDLTVVLEKLWATGSFDDIKFEVEDEKDGKKLIIHVVERAVVKDVDFRGGTEVGLSSVKDKIKEKKLTINPDSIYDPEAVRKIKDLIVDECAEKGFRNPVIAVTLEPMGPGMVRLVFDIKEGGKARIYHLVFRGNKAISTATLKSAMGKTRTHWWLSWLTSHDLLIEKNMEDDIANIKKLYWRKGYKDVFVGKPTIEVEDRTTEAQKKKNIKRINQGKSPKYDMRASLNIPVLEGEAYSEGKLKISGNDSVFKGPKGEEFYRLKIAEVRRDNRSWWAGFLNLKPSPDDLPADKIRPFDLDALNQGVEKIKEGYGNLGYIMFKADKQLDVRVENGVKKVDVTLKVDEGEQYTIRRINFEGNTLTKDKVLRRSMIIKEGDAFQTERFKDSFTGLGQLGFFDVKTSEPKVDLVPDKPQVDITLKGMESGVNELLFQGGYGSVLGFSLGASFSTKNLGGGGETLSVSYTGGAYQRATTVSYTEPYVFDLPYSFSASVSKSSTDYSASRVGASYAYQQYSKGLTLAVGTRLSTFLHNQTWAWFTTYSTSYSFRIMQIQGERNYYFRDTAAELTSTLGQTITYSTINHPFKPTSGTKLSFAYEYGGWQFGTDKPLYRSTLEFEKVASLTDRNTFLLNTSYGYVRDLGTESLPIWDLYRPGGESSLRGYRYGQVGTAMVDNTNTSVVVGGNKQFIANLEYQFKIADQFRTVLFYDMGNAWAPGVKVFSEALRRSVGVELRFFLPISPAPLRLIWARKLNPYDFDTSGKMDFQFSIGSTF